MRLIPLTDHDCGTNSCPQVYASDHGTIVVQGTLVTDDTVLPGPGEVLVEIPAEIFRAAAAAVSDRPA
ncbi:hypothetical protein I6A60_31735 [Frankia sp. AgB1.9]|uniref:hypothetical protein n=1 Tax=unclassified Frankia TaxID=2632575 RepID=UPI001932B2C9|nr:MULTISPECIES: hypothetical protein [unclassified Frankia]MBL7493833.1 hypothetical protein [Frankia sp. AgW1.1]MBL7552400.1 hypothetical protein [Frankia sp. AgB1.9]MBL7619627.1 hypothetical protein [Frankia sp. AgB1.8]